MRMPRTDERGSIPMALLIITIVLAMSAAIAPVVIRQITSTRNLQDRNSALNAAQAGMDMMMAKVRAAAKMTDEGVNSGLLENLPGCTLSGDAMVPGTTESLKYAVSLAYFDQESKPLSCPPNSVPTTAKVTSIGTSRQVNRTLTATYVFTTSNTNIPGGQLRIDSVPATVTGTQCIDAGPDRSPVAGTAVTMKACNGSSEQQFGYTADLYLKLINSESSDNNAPYGMCLDAGATHKSGNPIVFGPCPQTRTARYQWALDGSSRFNTTNLSTGKADTSLCMNVTTPSSTGGGVSLNNCTATSTKNIWRSGAGVGTGMAGDNTAQLVNYAQFSRCLDVTDQSYDSSYMIAWFCKQSPDGVVDWNQRWVHPVPTPPAVYKTGNIVVTFLRSGQQNDKYYNKPLCLKSPRSTASSAYTTVVLCDTVAKQAPPELQWTVYHDTGDYGTSYRIKDSAGYCLTPTDQNAKPLDVHKDGTSKVKVAVCNSSELQKWNAPANISNPTPLTDLVEK
ncbi:Ricin-type beta-trefoil lectin domain-containing protein [Paractinoplanes atraurantiacus]|uniref:Ricin-type beta-trefoil lectin domain-containing protein n=2 Tax=Paractinoplanes atraurantiacus TaxID=1036182 RepID=A0A285K3A6_9ACTN|nr:Ricin-type beta-trefoil lectin domain-containing protein [Actinoplanes atraurantiacus]